MRGPCSVAHHPPWRHLAGPQLVQTQPVSKSLGPSSNPLPALGITTLSASSPPIGNTRALSRLIIYQIGSENSCFPWMWTFSKCLTWGWLLPGAPCLKIGEKGSQQSTNCEETTPKLTQTLSSHQLILFTATKSTVQRRSRISALLLYLLIMSPGSDWAIILLQIMTTSGLPRLLSGLNKKSTCQCRRRRWCRFDPWIRKSPWRKA